MEELISKKDITIQKNFKYLSLISELKVTKIICVSYCKIDCSCLIAESKNNDLCQLFNKTALNYLTEKIEADNEFIYFKK